MTEAAVEPTDAEYEEATALFQDDFRIRDLARLLAQLRAANLREKGLRVRMFMTGCHKGATNHSTACTIWGDNGQDGTAEGFPEPLPCNCGALRNYEKSLREAAEVQLKAANERAKENFNDAKAYAEAAQCERERAEAAKWQRERAEAAEAIAAVSEHQTENPRKPS